MDANLVVLIQSAFSGLLFGSLFGIMAMGITMVWGILRIANFAHLSFVAFAAYLTYSLLAIEISLPDGSGTYHMHPLLPLVIITPLFFLLGIVIQWVFERFKVSTFTSILLTFGLFIVIENIITFLWTADVLTTREFMERSFRAAIRFPVPLDQFFVLPPDLLAFIAAVVLAALTYVLLRYTPWGRSVRAMAQDPFMARAFGVNTRRQALLLSGLATTYAGVAGVFVAIKTPLTPTLPLSWVGIVIAAVIIGGLGNPFGALAAAGLLKMIEGLWMANNPPGWAPLISFTVLVIYLVVQPNLLLRNWRTRRMALATRSNRLVKAK